MGRMIKNAVPRTASHAIGLPVGTSSIGPDSAVVGQTRWNSDTSRFEYYDGSAWKYVAHEGFANVIVNNSAVGDGANVIIENAMTISYDAGQEALVLVHVGTVYQIPNVNYTFLGNTSIKFSSAPSGGAAITVVHNLASTAAV